MLKDQAFRLIIGSGFSLKSVVPKPNYHLFKVERTELLGTLNKCHIAISDSVFVKADVASLLKEAGRSGASLVLVGECEEDVSPVPLLTLEQFEDRLGGPILSLLPLDKNYSARLVDLGHNKVPAGLQGEASDLFEQYVHAGLQFLFYSRVVRYGQDRRFEKVADGIAIGTDIPLLLYDAKAYSDGYDVNADSVRQFSGYVNDFHRRYQRQVGTVASFLVISGKFPGGKASLENKSADMRAATSGVGLCFISAEVLAEMVKLLVEKPAYRSSVDWSRLFVNTTLSSSGIQSAFRSAQRDKVI